MAASPLARLPKGESGPVLPLPEGDATGVAAPGEESHEGGSPAGAVHSVPVDGQDAHDEGLLHYTPLSTSLAPNAGRTLDTSQWSKLAEEVGRIPSTGSNKSDFRFQLEQQQQRRRSQESITHTNRQSETDSPGRRRLEESDVVSEGRRSSFQAMRAKRFQRQHSQVSLSNLFQGLQIRDFATRGRRVSQFTESMHLFLEDKDSSAWARCYFRVMPVLVLASACTALLQIMIEEPFLHGLGAAVVESVFDGIFTLEVLVRLAVSPVPLRFFTSPCNLIDLFAALALPLRLAVGFELPSKGVDKDPVVVILLCLVPVVRLLKLLRRWEQVHLLTKAFADVFEALPVLLYPLSIFTLFFASLIYLVEPMENIGSLGKAVWLTIVTMTTVGYGDVTPESAAGHFIVGTLVIFSVLYMAMPIGIIGVAFTNVWQERDKILLMRRTRQRLTDWGYTAHDIVQLFDAFDHRRRGALTIHEFRVMIRKLKLGMTDSRVVQLFNLFDRDSSGRIDDKEFVRTLFPDKFLEVYGGDLKDSAALPRPSQSRG